jgi:flagellar basal body-associated protein FliL
MPIDVIKSFLKYKSNVIVTVLCTLIGIGFGFLIAKQSAKDARQEYHKRLLNSAINELEYNLQISWYNDEKYIEMATTFSALNTKALWEVYYNFEEIFGDQQAIKKDIKNCLNEIDWINRLVPSQYSPEILSPVIAYFEGQLTEESIKANTEQLMQYLHEKMYDKYQSSAKILMSEVRDYLVNMRDKID